jgi:O-antigen ligase
MPFEAIQFEARGASSLPRLAGLLFSSACLLYPKVYFRRPLPALWWFAGYALVLGLSDLFIPEMFIQLLIMGWLGSTLVQEEKLLRHTVLTFSIATLLLATGMLTGLPGFSQMKGGRLSAVGVNPNGLAGVLALGAQALIGLGIEQTPRKRWMRVTFMTMSFFPLAALVYTGSRSAVLGSVAGIAVYALPYYKSKRKMMAILAAAIAVIGVVYIVVNNQITSSRFEMTYETGNMAGREKIFPNAIEMIFEKPFLGWGPVEAFYELGRREGSGISRDAHNLFLHLLLEVGLLGAAPFLIGLGLCVRAAWTARGCSLGLLPLAWLVSMLVFSMSGTTHTSKLMWLVLIVSLASEASIVKQYKRKNLMIRTVLQHSRRENMNHTINM